MLEEQSERVRFSYNSKVKTSGIYLGEAFLSQQIFATVNYIT